MKLHENLNRIKSIMGVITEASKKDILINKFGLIPEIAETLYEVCGPLTIWMFNKLINYQIAINRSYNIPDKTKEEVIKHFNDHPDTIVRIWKQRIVGIMDYIRVGLNGDISTIKDNTFTELERLAADWHHNLQIGGGKINYKEENPIVIDFGNGYYWADLETNDSREECDRMGHCGRTSRENTIFSLRQNVKLPGNKYTINKSILTAAIDTNQGILYQLKGPKNSKPSKEYFKYILPLFKLQDEETDKYLIKYIGREYGHENDFKIADLSEKEILEFMDERPDFFNEENVDVIDEIGLKYPDLLPIIYEINKEVFNIDGGSIIYKKPQNYPKLIEMIYVDNPEWFENARLKYTLFNMGLIDKDPIQWEFEFDILPEDVEDYVDGGWAVGKRKTKYGGTRDVSLFEKILEGDAWDLYESYDVDWTSSIEYHLDDENEKLIYEKLKQLNPDTEFDEDMDLTELIEEYDGTDEIKDAIRRATSSAESDDYVNHIEKELKNELEEYGDVLYMGDEGVKLKINLKVIYNNIYDDSYFWEYMDNCDYDSPCTFKELVAQGDVDKPTFGIDDRWYPDIDNNNFNDILTDRLNEIR